MFLKLAFLEVVLLIVTIPMLYMGYEKSSNNLTTVKNIQIQNMVLNILNRNKDISLMDEETLCINNDFDLIRYQNTWKQDLTCLNSIIGSKNKLIIKDVVDGKKEIILQKMDWAIFKDMFTLNF